MWNFILILSAVAVSLIPSRASGDIVYLQFLSSATIDGDVDGNSFSNLSWGFELAVNDNVLDSDGASDNGFFSDAIIGGNLNLDGVVYELAASNFATTVVQMSDGSKAGANVNYVTGVLDGGWIEFVANNGVAFPGAFADNNTLSSATGVASGANSSINDWGYAGNIRFTQISTTTGEVIKITDQDLASGTTFVTGSSTSLYSNVVPEPSGAALFLFLLTIMTLKRQRAIR